MADERLRQLERAQQVDPHDVALQEQLRHERRRTGKCIWCGTALAIPYAQCGHCCGECREKKAWTVLDVAGFEIGPGESWQAEIPSRPGDRIRGLVAVSHGRGVLHLYQGAQDTLIGAAADGSASSHSFDLCVDHGPKVSLLYQYDLFQVQGDGLAKLRATVHVGSSEKPCRDCPGRDS